MSTKCPSKQQPWKEEEVALLSTNLPTAEIARRLGRTLVSVRRKRENLGIKCAPASESTLETDVSRASESYWRDQHRQLVGKYEKLLSKVTLEDRLCAGALELAPRSYQPAPSIHRHSGGKGSPQSAVLVLSDTHIGQVVHKDQTLGFGDYNFDVFMARLKYLEESVLSIIRDHVNTSVPELHICMLGDMMHGALSHYVEAGQVNTRFVQFYSGAHVLAQFLRSVARVAPAVHIHTAVGNHTRWDSQKKMPKQNRYSNLDMFLYAMLEALTRDITTIHWHLDKQPFAIFQVQDWVLHASHGDHLRGGDRALGIPAHDVGRMISTTNQLYSARSMPSPNYYIVGHWHKGISLSHAHGEFLFNGGFPGIDDNGLASSYSPVDPMQRFFLVHPRYGKTADYRIDLKFAEVGKAAPYVVPQAFTSI